MCTAEGDLVQGVPDFASLVAGGPGQEGTGLHLHYQGGLVRTDPRSRFEGTWRGQHRVVNTGWSTGVGH